jgi:hypothetical protein
MDTFISNSSNYYNVNETIKIREYMFNMLPWLRNMVEDKYSVSHHVPFNTIITKKLFNLKSIYRHIFGVPYPVIEMMMEKLHNGVGQNPIHFVKSWKEMKKVLINIENLKVELFGHSEFMDAWKMASSLNQKINCSWGVKRFREEHDLWAKEIANVLLLNQKNTKMNIYHIYEDFAKHTGFELLRTNFDMVHDGLIMNHCVATYINKVDRGECGIYKVDGYTIELNFKFSQNKSKKTLEIGQIKGYKNSKAPQELVNLVHYMLESFNTQLLPNINLQPHNLLHEILVEVNDLPF